MTPLERYQSYVRGLQALYPHGRPPAHLERLANDLYIDYLNSDPEIVAYVTRIGETE